MIDERDKQGETMAQIKESCSKELADITMPGVGCEEHVVVVVVGDQGEMVEPVHANGTKQASKLSFLLKFPLHH